MSCKCAFPWSLEAKRKVGMLWERCNIPWMQTQELCLGCKDGTHEGVEQREELPQGSRDPSSEMTPSTAWTWNARPEFCRICGHRSSRNVSGMGESPCGITEIPHLRGKEAPVTCWTFPGIAPPAIPRDAAQRGQGRAGGTYAPTFPAEHPERCQLKFPQNQALPRALHPLILISQSSTPEASPCAGSVSHSPSFPGKGGSSGSGSSKPCPHPQWAVPRPAVMPPLSQALLTVTDGGQRDNGSRGTWIKISTLFTSVTCPGRAGGGSHEFQGFLGSSWDDRGWEGEGASPRMVKSGRMGMQQR